MQIAVVDVVTSSLAPGDAVPLVTYRVGYRNFLRGGGGGGGGARLIKVIRKWAWVPKRGWVREIPLPRKARKLLIVFKY